MKMNRIAYFSMYLSSVLVPLSAFAQQPGPQQHQWDWPGHWHMWGGGVFWWIFPLLMLLMMLLCLAMFFGGHKRFHQPGSHQSSNGSRDDPTYSALRILNDRYAKGEIKRDEYDEKKAVILGDVP